MSRRLTDRLLSTSMLEAILDVVVFVCFVVAVAVACGGCFVRGIGPDKKIHLYGCVDDGAGEVAARAVAMWPELATVVDNGVDVFCVDRVRIESPGVCGKALAAHPESCARWPGGDNPLDLNPARIYVAVDEPLAASVGHELAHLRPSVWKLKDACAHHTPDCWDKAALARVVGAR